MTSVNGPVATAGAGQEKPATPGFEQDSGHVQKVTPVSWHPGPSISMRQWVIDGQRLGAIGRGVAWWLGDWLRFGNAKFGERYVRASRITGYDVQTLMNIVYVTSRFEACRRREKLSWSHHAELAALDPDEQDRWLGRAETQRLSVRDLRAEVRRATRPRKARRAMPSEAGGDEVTVSPAQARLPSAREELVCPHCGHEFAVASAAVASRNGHALDPVDR